MRDRSREWRISLGDAYVYYLNRVVHSTFTPPHVLRAYVLHMLYQFLATNRDDLIERCREKVSQRNSAGTTDRELSFGITVFLDQLIKTLEVEQGSDPESSRKVSGPASGIPAYSEIGDKASRHGSELLAHGFTVEDVVHDYGDLCQAITDLAFEVNAPIGTDEFRTLNRCLDNAIATATSEFAYLREKATAEEHAFTMNERLGSLAHDLRNQLSTATLAFDVIKSGKVAVTGATGAVLDRSLVGMRHLIDRSLSDARLAAGLAVEPSLFSLAVFITEIKLSAALEANLRDRHLIVTAVDPTLALSGDRDLLMSAVGNLLQNAFKFSKQGGEVTLNAYASGERILIDVEDSCGGLPKGAMETMFQPFVQLSGNKTGVGLGLSISRRSVEASGGELSVRDLPGGCVFTIDLPRYVRDDALPPDMSPRTADTY